MALYKRENLDTVRKASVMCTHMEDHVRTQGEDDPV